MAASSLWTEWFFDPRRGDNGCLDNVKFFVRNGRTLCVYDITPLPYCVFNVIVIIISLSFLQKVYVYENNSRQS